ncbi:MAG: hypothetical protein ACP5OC_00090 [Thermoplasmata archaeon]
MLVSHCDLHGEVTAPGSKSFTQRAVLISAFSSTPLALGNVAFCDDDLISIEIAKKCGLNVSSYKNSIKVQGEFRNPDRIFAGESGTSYRLVIGLLAGKRSVIDIEVSRQLAGRPIRPLLDALSERGLTYRLNDLTLHLDGSRITSGKIRIDGSESSQFVSACILFQSMIGGEGIVMISERSVSSGYVKLTASILSRFGPAVKETGDGFKVTGEFNHAPLSLSADGDYSAAGFLFAAGLLCSPDGIIVHGLQHNSDQPDSAILQMIPCNSEAAKEGSYTVSKRQLEQITVDAASNPDLAPPLAVLGMFSEAGCRIMNPGRLRGKESDRYADIKRLARAFGSRIQDSGDLLFIRKGDSGRHPELLEFTEHRMIMAGIIAGIASGKPVMHSNVEKIAKSYPSFLSDLKRLGAGVEFL